MRPRLSVPVVLFVLVAATLILPGPAFADRIAILEFVGDGSFSDLEVVLLTDKVRTSAVQQLPGEGWSVLTRENMLVMLEANAEDLAACEGECEVETGRLLGADQVVAGSASKFGTQYVVLLRSYDTSTGQVLRGAEARASDLDRLWEELREATASLFRTPGSSPSEPIEFVSLHAFIKGGKSMSWAQLQGDLRANPSSDYLARKSNATAAVGTALLTVGAVCLSVYLITPGASGDSGDYIYNGGNIAAGISGLTMLSVGGGLLGSVKRQRIETIDAYNSQVVAATHSAPRAPRVEYSFSPGSFILNF